MCRATTEMWLVTPSMEGDLLFIDRAVLTMDGPLMAKGTTRGSIDFFYGRGLWRRGRVSPRLTIMRADEIRVIDVPLGTILTAGIPGVSIVFVEISTSAARFPRDLQGSTMWSIDFFDGRGLWRRDRVSPRPKIKRGEKLKSQSISFFWQRLTSHHLQQESENKKTTNTKKLNFKNSFDQGRESGSHFWVDCSQTETYSTTDHTYYLSFNLKLIKHHLHISSWGLIRKWSSLATMTGSMRRLTHQTLESVKTPL